AGFPGGRSSPGRRASCPAPPATWRVTPCRPRPTPRDAAPLPCATAGRGYARRSRLQRRLPPARPQAQSSTNGAGGPARAICPALVGYFVGTRQRSPAGGIPATAAPAATPVAPAATPVAPAPPAVEERVGTDGFGDEKARLIRSRDSEAAALRRELTDREPAI